MLPKARIAKPLGAADALRHIIIIGNSVGSKKELMMVDKRRIKMTQRSLESAYLALPGHPDQAGAQPGAVARTVSLGETRGRESLSWISGERGGGFRPCRDDCAPQERRPTPFHTSGYIPFQGGGGIGGEERKGVGSRYYGQAGKEAVVFGRAAMIARRKKDSRPRFTPAKGNALTGGVVAHFGRSKSMEYGLMMTLSQRRRVCWQNAGWILASLVYIYIATFFLLMDPRFDSTIEPATERVTNFYSSYRFAGFYCPSGSIYYFPQTSLANKVFLPIEAVRNLTSATRALEPLPRTDSGAHDE